MQIQLNGSLKEIADGSSVQALVEALSLDITRIAVEKSGAIVPKSQYGQTPLAANDAVEIVQLIGGG